MKLLVVLAEGLEEAGCVRRFKEEADPFFLAELEDALVLPAGVIVGQRDDRARDLPGRQLLVEHLHQIKEGGASLDAALRVGDQGERTVVEDLVNLVVEPFEVVEDEVRCDALAGDDELEAVVHPTESPAHHHRVALAVLVFHIEAEVLRPGGELSLLIPLVVGVVNELRRLVEVDNAPGIFDFPLDFHDPRIDELILEAMEAVEVLLSDFVAVLCGPLRFHLLLDLGHNLIRVAGVQAGKILLRGHVAAENIVLDGVEGDVCPTAPPVLNTTLQ